jgi:hypothetical protein
MRVGGFGSCFLRTILVAGGVVLLITPGAARKVLAVGGSGPSSSQNVPAPRPAEPPPDLSVGPQTDMGSPPGITPKQRHAILQERFKKMKEQAGELAKLAQALQADLDKSNEDVLSLRVVQKADKIEKLAKQIKSAAIE